MAQTPTLVRCLTLVSGTLLVYPWADRDCQAQGHISLRLQSSPVFALQVGEGGKSTFTNMLPV